jgi:hypothetical protein
LKHSYVSWFRDVKNDINSPILLPIALLNHSISYVSLCHNTIMT